MSARRNVTNVTTGLFDLCHCTRVGTQSRLSRGGYIVYLDTLLSARLIMCRRPRFATSRYQICERAATGWKEAVSRSRAAVFCWQMESTAGLAAALLESWCVLGADEERAAETGPLANVQAPRLGGPCPRFIHPRGSGRRGQSAAQRGPAPRKALDCPG